MPRLSTPKSRIIAASGFVPFVALLAIKGWLYPSAPEALVRILIFLPVLAMFAAKNVREAEGAFISDEDLVRSGLKPIGNMEAVIALMLMAPIGVCFWALDRPIAERRIIFELSCLAICATFVVLEIVDRKARRILAQIAQAKSLG
jgi:hypothetical protein